VGVRAWAKKGVVHTVTKGILRSIPASVNAFNSSTDAFISATASGLTLMLPSSCTCILVRRLLELCLAQKGWSECRRVTKRTAYPFLRKYSVESEPRVPSEHKRKKEIQRHDGIN